MVPLTDTQGWYVVRLSLPGAMSIQVDDESAEVLVREGLIESALPCLGCGRMYSITEKGRLWAAAFHLPREKQPC